MKNVTSSNIVTPSAETMFRVAEGADLTDDEKGILRERGLRLSFH